ncbi:MAG: glycoside hydrolase family 15 protein [Phycisphaeraceae bacterium]|nr:glycoside hydrolase family 15 protein [Phycisphaeraceae bacterium]
MAYLPIENYGVIGNLRTTAHVGLNGSIDWLCMPQFDSSSVFAAILDDDKGGRFSVSPVENHGAARQFYWPDTNVLVTRFQSHEGVAELIDFMPMGGQSAAAPLDDPHTPSIVRICRGVFGRVNVRVHCRPAFDYARAKHQCTIVPWGAVFESPEAYLHVTSTTPLAAQDSGGVGADVKLEAGQTIVLSLYHGIGKAPAHGKTEILHEPHANKLLEHTIGYWRRWIQGCTYTGRWREMVRRSALTLKMLTFEPTGAIVAAPTCSLPAPIGGERNWDYRYTWVRDAAFTLYGLMRVGLVHETDAFMHWVDARIHELTPDGMLQPLYRLDGRHEVEEITLDHLEGYRGSRPVRIGNAAYQQLQIDVCGELMDSVYLYNKYATPISYDTWRQLTRVMNWVCKNWTRPDRGVWEVRGPEHHFLYSKVMCWVALDRGIRLAEKRSFPGDLLGWRNVRDEIYREVMDKGYHPGRGAFVQHYDTDTLDAANLAFPLVFFLAPNDPRMLRTLDAISRPLTERGLTADTQVYRYRQDETDDGLSGNEGGFNICTLWMIEAQTRAGRFQPERLEKARVLFEKFLGYANHVGLYAEQTGMRGEALGNFPQAFTHLAFISAAFNLDRALGGSRGE